MDETPDSNAGALVPARSKRRSERFASNLPAVPLLRRQSTLLSDMFQPASNLPAMPSVRRQSTMFADMFLPKKKEPVK